jgi:hypothetical protein
MVRRPEERWTMARSFLLSLVNDGLLDMAVDWLKKGGSMIQVRDEARREYEKKGDTVSMYGSAMGKGPESRMERIAGKLEAGIGLRDVRALVDKADGRYDVVLWGLKGLAVGKYEEISRWNEGYLSEVEKKLKKAYFDLASALGAAESEIGRLVAEIKRLS